MKNNIYETLKRDLKSYLEERDNKNDLYRLYQLGKIGVEDLPYDFFYDDIEFNEYMDFCATDEPYVPFKIESSYDVLDKENIDIKSKIENINEVISAISKLFGIMKEDFKYIFRKENDKIISTIMIEAYVPFYQNVKTVDMIKYAFETNGYFAKAKHPKLYKDAIMCWQFDSIL